jgi:hypothetical protein
MIEIIQNYDDLFRLVRDLERLQDRGLTRFSIHGFQKHGDDTFDVPEDGGCYHIDEIIWRLEHALDKAMMMDYKIKFSREANKKEDEDLL